MEIQKTVENQRSLFETGCTIDIAYRKKALKQLINGIKTHTDEINEALMQDLHKSTFESYMTEVGMVLEELKYQLHHLDKWSKKTREATTISQFPAKGFSVAEPYGVVLIMAPWNYPFMLSMEPLAGAIAAGNCCVLKPSNYSPHVSTVMKKLLGESFAENYITVIEGGREQNTELLEQRFDYIFFTGGKTVGRLVLEKAAKYLTPVSLELGGKSPCIITDSTDCTMAAKRLVWGKFLNSGQTCVAPDYVLADARIVDELLEKIKFWIEKMFGSEPLKNPEYPKMINEKHFDRVLGYLSGEKVYTGGASDKSTLQIEPTILIGCREESPVMKEEIFGPVLPILSYNSINEAVKFITSRPKPLALYLFTNDKKLEDRFLRFVPFGGGCINDTVLHLASPAMGFGGVGGSGMGSYHGKYSFETFSHRKSIVKKGFFADLPFRYHPYTATKEKILKLLM